MLKALVWFWLIDETLSTNLVYQSDYEIGSITPNGEAKEGQRIGAKNSLPSPIQCGWETMGRAESSSLVLVN